MYRLKKPYLKPEMTVAFVECESPICGGSVQYGSYGNVSINSQNIVDADNNDFSNTSWTVNSGQQTQPQHSEW